MKTVNYKRWLGLFTVLLQFTKSDCTYPPNKSRLAMLHIVEDRSIHILSLLRSNHTVAQEISTFLQKELLSPSERYSL